jgi:hypothetical protein
MAPADKQFTFRLPNDLVERIDHCLEQMRRSGLSVNRTDIVRMLITRALSSIRECNIDELLSAPDRPTPA